MLVWKKSDAAGAKACLEDLLKILKAVPESDWEMKKIEEIIMKYIKDNSKGVGDYLWPMRVALTGEKASPSPFEMAWALGKAETLLKIKGAISKL
jgi:glutamyl-tRNA synthetase